MSRCFPFPHILNGIRNEAVIKSIKVAEEKSKKEERTKERKREKKREGKEKTRSNSHKRRRKEDDKNQKVFKQSEIESLEKSSLTVEHELLQTTSCDSTHNNNELLQKQHKEKKSLDDRHKHNNELQNQQILNGRHNNDSESTIRIKLPIRRQKDLEMMMVMNKDQQKLLDSSSSTKEKRIPSSSSTGLLCSFCPPSMAMEFLSVVEDWVPNTIERRRVEDEECWWLSKKKLSNHKFDTQFNKEIKQGIISSSMAWPCARLLPEADFYSLPYTVPF